MATSRQPTHVKHIEQDFPVLPSHAALLGEITKLVAGCETIAPPPAFTIGYPSTVPSAYTSNVSSLALETLYHLKRGLTLPMLPKEYRPRFKATYYTKPYGGSWCKLTVYDHFRARLFPGSLTHAAHLRALGVAARWPESEGHDDRDMHHHMLAAETRAGSLSRAGAGAGVGLTVELRPDQLQTLAFMVDNETAPLADTMPTALAATLAGGGWVISTSGGQFPDAYCCVTNAPNPRIMPASAVTAQTAGFIFEQPGWGKTVAIAALIATRPPPPTTPPAGAEAATDDLPLVTSVPMRLSALAPAGGTLVVCPAFLTRQWDAELRAKIPGIRVCIHHGPRRTKEPAKIGLDSFDVVITSYKVLSVEIGAPASRGSAPFGVRWHRLVLDEAHDLGKPGSCCITTLSALCATHKWALTGTPDAAMMRKFTGMRDVARTPARVLEGMVSAMGLPWCTENSAAAAYVLERYAVRHAASANSAAPPEHSERVIEVVMPPNVRARYEALRAEALEVAAGNVSYMHIRAALHPLRLLASGAGNLTAGMLDAWQPEQTIGVPEFMAGLPAADNLLVAPTEEPCPVCLDAHVQPVVTECGHWFCAECFGGVAAFSSANTLACPMCRAAVVPAGMRLGITPAHAKHLAHMEEQAAAAAALVALAGGESAPTVEAPVEVPAEDAEDLGGDIEVNFKVPVLLELLAGGGKSIVFSSHSSVLKYLRGRLADAGYIVSVATSDLPVQRRAREIEKFQHGPNNVLLLGVKSGAVGLTLTAATRVVFFDPCASVAMEAQAVARAVRTTQRASVEVVHLLTRGTVEPGIRAHRSGSVDTMTALFAATEDVAGPSGVAASGSNKRARFS